MKLNQKSKGFGDTVAKFTEITGIAKIVEVVADALDIEDCGCDKRRELLNALIPYSMYNEAEHGASSVIKQVDGQSIAVFE